MKRIAVLLAKKEGYSEGLRMAAGLSLLDDKVDIYLLNHDFAEADSAAIENHLDMMRAVGIGLYSNFKKEGFNFISGSDLGKNLLKYDYVFSYR
jgi:hypothetical protein